ncbi:MAG: hypothetical protein RLZZ137_70 [Cyanobacteriota bacterium]|jgi:hypothetical protein
MGRKPLCVLYDKLTAASKQVTSEAFRSEMKKVVPW